MNQIVKHNPIIALLITLMTIAIATPASAQRVLDKEEIRQLNGVDLLEAQGAKLPMDAVFTTADGPTQPSTQGSSSSQDQKNPSKHSQAPSVSHSTKSLEANTHTQSR